MLGLVFNNEVKSKINLKARGSSKENHYKQKFAVGIKQEWKSKFELL